MSFARTRIAYTAVALVEITLVIAIIALLVAMAFPSFLRARKRGQAFQISNRLRVIDTRLRQGSGVASRALRSNGC
jgi:type II secretory pathway pseudopilin PulG